MRFTVFILVLTCAVGVLVDGFSLNFWKLRSAIKQNELRRRQMQRVLTPKAPQQFLYGFDITQPLDHFDPLIKTTFKQIYFVNDLYWKRPNGPVFLYIGGEGKLNPEDAEFGAYVKFAEKYGALIFAVEHRFYGRSLNNDGLKLENLKFLSSQQALADLASFHLQASKKYNLTEENKWISFGGSYPGALSAWFRIKYPHLVHAAVASSAPVRALTNFEGYNDVVAKSLATEIVGGSDQCLLMVRKAFKSVDDLIKKRQLKQLASDFLSCKPLDSDLDVVQSVSNLAGIFMGTVQYNNEDPMGLNVESVCQYMTSGADAYKNLITLNKEFLGRSYQKCSDNSWQNSIDQLSSVAFDVNADMRQWTYQTCSQFGYFQTCDEDKCAFSRYMVLSPNFKICQSVFNLTETEVNERIDFTNSYYGSDKPQGSRVLFVNGLVDPWHALSVLEDVSPTEQAIVIPGTAHCADMGDDQQGDPPALRDARKKILTKIGEWLAV